MKKIDVAARLRCGVAPVILATALISPSIAIAQDETPQEAQEAQEAGYGQNVIVVTGSILRQTDNQLVSPISVVTTDSLDKRGIATVQEGLQSLAANNGPALTNSFSANGAFASGASALSLRGLSTSSTLVLFDGLRAAYYPLSDDGTRNFVDLNTIPDDIIERVEVLRDGASSSYGADAIAGVVNIITKREFKGVSLRGDTGISSRGDAPEYRFSATAGMGDIDDDGYNAYISGFYYHSGQLKNSDRPFPYNTGDFRSICNDGVCGQNNVVNGLDGDGLYSQGLISLIRGNYMVQPYDATNTTPLGPYQNLSSDCGPGTPYTLNAADQANAPDAPSTVCQYDRINLYGVIQPKIDRFGVSAKFTGRISDSVEAYTEVNFVQTKSSYTEFPADIYTHAPTGIYYPRYSARASGGAFTADSGPLTLPIYVCPERVNCDTSPNRTLNPNNPFAAQGQVARLVGLDPNHIRSTETLSRTYRLAFGVNGDLTDRWHFDVSGTAMHVDLRKTENGYPYIQHLLDVIADGSYNFIDPSSNSQAVNDYLYPTNITNSTSDQYQIQAVVQGELMDLPGGPLQIGVGGSVRYEAVDAPSGNSDFNGPTERYFTLNAFGTKGDRTVTSAYAELQAPILDQVEINVSGRYDHYSSGQSAFSPKAGIKFRPTKSLMIRGTWSRGFRIPSFAEANALPTTGYVTNTSQLFNDGYLAQYGCTVDTFASCPTYIRQGSYGLTTLASPDLDPEKSRSFTLGVFYEPIRNVSLSVDFYDIKKTGAITNASTGPAIDAYYNGEAIPDGFNVIADAPDPNFPNATPRIAFVEANLINANTIVSRGLDFAINANHDFGEVSWASNLEASYIMLLETRFPDGTKERYDGTLGNFNLTAGSGTPKWHGTWINSIGYKDWTFTGTVNYFDGYDLSAMDQGNDYKDCGLNDGSQPCRVESYITFDANIAVRVMDRFTISATMLNVFDNMPPVDLVTYGANAYNPVQGGRGILGRYFKLGAKVDF